MTNITQAPIVHLAKPLQRTMQGNQQAECLEWFPAEGKDFADNAPMGGLLCPKCSAKRGGGISGGR